MKEIEMKYAEYKNNYSDCKTKKDSYNKESKTIIVYIESESEKLITKATEYFKNNMGLNEEFITLEYVAGTRKHYKIMKTINEKAALDFGVVYESESEDENRIIAIPSRFSEIAKETIEEILN